MVGRSPEILVLDTNVVLHQTDLLEQSALRNVVIPSTTLEEVRHNSGQVYNAVRQVISDTGPSFLALPPPPVCVSRVVCRVPCVVQT